jgi:hypothetical protein
MQKGHPTWSDALFYGFVSLFAHCYATVLAFDHAGREAFQEVVVVRGH